MSSRFRDLLLILVVVLASNGAGIWFYSKNATACNQAMDSLTAELSQLRETIDGLQKEKEVLAKKAEAYFLQILDLQDELSGAKDKNQELAEENKRLRKELENQPISVPTSYEVLGDQIVYQSKPYRSLKGSFVFNVGVGYGTKGVKLKVDGNTVYGDPQYGLFPVLGTSYFLTDTQGIGLQVQGNEALILNYSLSSDFFGK